MMPTMSTFTKRHSGCVTLASNWASFLRISVLVTMALLASASSSSEELKTKWSESCQDGKTQFELSFTSKGGDPTDDDMVVTMKWGAARPTILPLKEALFVSADFISDADNLCKSVGAFKLPSGRLLLLLPKDDRPSEDRLIAVVLDHSNGAVVEVVGDVGSYDKFVMLIQEPAGYRMLLLRKWYGNLGGGGGEFGAPDWMSIRESAGHVSYKWETDRR